MQPGPRLDAAQEEALFRELRRRGAFRALPEVRLEGAADERVVWDVLRDGGWGYDPVYAETARGCAWFRN